MKKVLSGHVCTSKPFCFCLFLLLIHSSGLELPLLCIVQPVVCGKHTASIASLALQRAVCLSYYWGHHVMMWLHECLTSRYSKCCVPHRHEELPRVAASMTLTGCVIDNADLRLRSAQQEQA